MWGELAGFFKAKQEHKHELVLMKTQAELEDKRAANALAAQRQQAELGYKTINVQADADISREESAAWRAAVERMNQPTGIKWVDAWNGAMRPAFYTLALTIVLFLCWTAGWDVDRLKAAGMIDLAFTIIGFLFADRSLVKRGK